jgi:hypothetical protein
VTQKASANSSDEQLAFGCAVQRLRRSAGVPSAGAPFSRRTFARRSPPHAARLSRRTPHAVRRTIAGSPVLFHAHRFPRIDPQ